MSQDGLMQFTRKDLLNDLKVLKSFYDIFGKEKLISWILNEDSDGNSITYPSQVDACSNNLL